MFYQDKTRRQDKARQDKARQDEDKTKDKQDKNEKEKHKNKRTVPIFLFKWLVGLKAKAREFIRIGTLPENPLGAFYILEHLL
jgi:hypothetical protein